MRTSEKYMKVLFIGHFHDGSGWTRAVSDLALACDYIGIDVVCRSIKLDKNIPPNKRIQELESKSTIGCDAVIQYVLPHFYEYNSDAGKNIGYFVGEGSNFSKIGWRYRARLMDEIWVPNRQLGKHIGVDYKVVHAAHDLSIYQERHKDFIEITDINIDSLKFYCIIDQVKRKNIEGLLEAFHSEFGTNEDVELTIKTSAKKEEFSKINNSICADLRKHRSKHLYKDILLITERLTDEQIQGLHQSLDCYISTSHGEAWNYPLADAIFHGNECIATNSEGHREYVPLSSGILVDGFWGPAKGTDSFPNYQTCDSNWFIPSINEIRKAMRQKYNERSFSKVRVRNKKQNRELINKFSYEAIGNRIKELI